MSYRRRRRDALLDRAENRTPIGVQHFDTDGVTNP